ncbi:hypothetical protein [Trinickia sp. Y13]|uniref:hypothetical protein n=1 Tax=Trinickia sp. Y13 TaxID=2917807 RepID=UPI0024062DCD|nr:hypothetical protein [Trinickia sp. Y13]MDG0027832.1 hypothetical protein [Trinickia sp. Y13]
MAMSGKISDRDWSVSVQTHPTEEGFACTIHVVHREEKGKFQHQFKHFKVFRTEQDAVLDGLREGTTWIRHKLAKSFCR